MCRVLLQRQIEESESFSFPAMLAGMSRPRKSSPKRRTGSAAGGNVFVTIVEAQNLNDQDGKATPDAGIAKWSDAYVRVQVGIP